jgi:hypothetical protein
MLSAGKGKYRVWLKEIGQGEDIILVLGGGEKTHIGSVVLCEPGKKPVTLNRKGHFDWMVAKPVAEKFSKKTGRPVVCVAGIHVNNATKKEIGILKGNCKKIENKI